VIEFFIQLIGEFVLQAVGEALVELGFHSLGEPFRKPVNPWLAAIGYALFGALLGGLSLLVFSSHFVPVGVLRLANLLLTPLAVGLFMSRLGAWRARRGNTLLRIDHFAYGYLFALAFALVRFRFAT
jgi:hypothetical protein